MPVTLSVQLFKSGKKKRFSHFEEALGGKYTLRFSMRMSQIKALKSLLYNR